MYDTKKFEVPFLYLFIHCLSLFTCDKVIQGLHLTEPKKRGTHSVAFWHQASSNIAGYELQTSLLSYSQSE